MSEAANIRTTARRTRLARVVLGAVAVGGLTASALAVGIANAATKHATAVVVSTAKNAKLGTVLVDGKTLYALVASKTPCTAACLKIWPPLELPKGVTKATAGSGVSAAKLGSVARSGGVRQVTYNGTALYFFVGDTAAGQVHGDVTDTWGKWSVLVTVKPVVTPAAPSSGSTTPTTSTPTTTAPGQVTTTTEPKPSTTTTEPKPVTTTTAPNAGGVAF